MADDPHVARRPRLALLTLGGTILTPHGGAPTLDPASLLEALPALTEVADVALHPLCAKPSAGLSLADLRLLSRRIEALEDVDGVVVVQGTDTLEETAFALALLAEGDRTLVLTGAMRTPDHPGADGLANLLAACRVAASPQAKGIGPLVVLNDEIHAARLVRKTHTSNPGAFSSAPFGPIGLVVENSVRIVLRALLTPRLALGEGSPVVPILTTGIDFEPEAVEALAGCVDGLVIAAAGGGHVAAKSVEALAQAAARVPVVLTSRTGQGQGLRETYGYPGGEIDLLGRGLVSSGLLDPIKARMLLKILLSNEKAVDAAGVFAAFSQGHFG